MSRRLYLASMAMAVFLLVTGFALLGVAVGFGLSPPVMANYVECVPAVNVGCRTAARKLNNFALYALAGGLVVSACGALGIASLWGDGK